MPQPQQKYYTHLGRDYVRISGLDGRFFLDDGKLYRRYKNKRGAEKVTEASHLQYVEYATDYLKERFPQQDKITAQLFNTAINARVDAEIFTPGWHTRDNGQRVYGVEIIYTDINGKPFRYGNDNVLTRLRIAQGLELPDLQKRKKGKEDIVKYLQPKNADTKPYFTALYKYFNTHKRHYTENSEKSLNDIEYLYLVEGEFKAFHMCKNGIPAVGLSGIHNFGSSHEGSSISRHNEAAGKYANARVFTNLNNYKKWQKWGLANKAHYDKIEQFIQTQPKDKQARMQAVLKAMRWKTNKQKGCVIQKAETVGAQLYPELIELIQQLPNLKGVVLLHDADALEGDEKRRIGSFYSSVRNFRLAMQGLDLEVYYSHIKPQFSVKGLKGIDDLIESKGKDIHGIKRDIGLIASENIVVPKPNEEAHNSMLAITRSIIRDVKKDVANCARQLTEMQRFGISFRKHQELGGRINRDLKRIEEYTKEIIASKKAFAKKMAIWKSEPVKHLPVKRFITNDHFVFMDLKSPRLALYDYFKKGLNADTVRYNRSQVHRGPKNAPASGENWAINLDWFEVRVKSDVFFNLDPWQERARDLREMPELLKFGEFELHWMGKNAGEFKYFYNVKHNGVEFGKLKGGSMSVGGVWKPDDCLFHAENQQLYYAGFFRRYDAFMKAIGASFQNFTRVDVALDFERGFFSPKMKGEEVERHQKNPIDFFTKHWIDGHIEKLGSNSKYGASGEIEKGALKLKGARIGGGTNSTRTFTIYNKTDELQQVHKPYIGEYHQNNGMNGQVYRAEMRLKNGEMKKFPYISNPNQLTTERMLVEIFKKTTKNFAEFVDSKVYSNVEAKRNRPKIELFDFSEVWEVKLLKRKRHEAKKTTGRSEQIQLKKFIKDFMHTNDTDYLRMFWRNVYRCDLKTDKIDYWHKDIANDLRLKHDDLFPMSFGALYRNMMEAQKKTYEDLERKPGLRDITVEHIELIGKDAYLYEDQEVQEVDEENQWLEWMQTGKHVSVPWGNEVDLIDMEIHKARPSRNTEKYEIDLNGNRVEYHRTSWADSVEEAKADLPDCEYLGSTKVYYEDGLKLITPREVHYFKNKDT